MKPLGHLAVSVIFLGFIQTAVIYGESTGEAGKVQSAASQSGPPSVKIESAPSATQSTVSTIDSNTQPSSADKLWLNADYSPRSAMNTVAVFRPQDLESYKAMSDEQKISYLQTNFPVIAKWDRLGSGRRKLLQDAAPEQVSAYDATASEDEEERIVIRALGSSGAVFQLAPQIRRATVEVLGGSMQQYDNMPEARKEQVFAEKMEDALLRLQGGRPMNTKLMQADAMRAFTLILLPHPAELTYLYAPLFSRGLKEGGAIAPGQLPAKALGDALTLLKTLVDSPAAQQKLEERFVAADPIGKAAILLPRVKFLADNHLQPSPILQVFAMAEGQQGVMKMQQWDPPYAGKWSSATKQERILELQHCTQLIYRSAVLALEDASVEEQLASQIGIAQEKLDRHSLIARYFGPTAEATAPDNNAKDKLYRAALVFHASLTLYLLASFPLQ